MMNNNNLIAYLLSEQVTTDANIKILSEDTGMDSSVTISADLQDCSEWNRNGRKYPVNVVKGGLEAENIQELIQNNSWFGEAGHPIDPTLNRQITVVQSNISHRIVSANIVGSIVKGVVKTMPTDRGREMARFLIEEAMKAAFSLRALGPVRETAQGKLVCSPLRMVTYDWVFFPSHRKAYETGIVASPMQSQLASKAPGLNESASYCIPLALNEATDYVKNESRNYKLVLDQLGFDHNSAILSENAKSIILTGKGDNKNERLVIGVESALSREIGDFLSKL